MWILKTRVLVRMSDGGGGGGEKKQEIIKGRIVLSELIFICWRRYVSERISRISEDDLIRSPLSTDLRDRKILDNLSAGFPGW